MKCIKKIRTVLAGILIVALFFTCFSVSAEEIIFEGINHGDSIALQPDSSSTIELSISRVTQIKSNWCWAACAEMAGTCVSGKRIYQNHIVQHIFGDTGNYSANDSQMLSAMSYAANGRSASKVGVLSFAQITNYLMQNKPVVGGFRYNLSKHLMVIHASRNPDYVKIIDPATNTYFSNGRMEFYLSSLQSGCTYNGQYIKYIDSFVYN